MESINHALLAWWQNHPMTRYLFQVETAVLTSLSPTLATTSLVQVGGPYHEPFLSELHCRPTIYCAQTVDGIRAPIHPVLATDQYTLPIADDTVAHVLLYHALETCRYPEPLLAECARILKPGGRVLVVCFKPYGSLSLLKKMGCLPPYPAAHWQCYSESALKVLCESQGLLPVHAHSHYLSAAQLSTVPLKASSLLAHCPASTLVIGEKRAPGMMPLIDCATVNSSSHQELQFERNNT